MTDNTDRDELDSLLARVWGEYSSAKVADAIMAQFLPAHDERVKAEAWREGADFIREVYERMLPEEFDWDRGEETVSALITQNPYRRES